MNDDRDEWEYMSVEELLSADADIVYGDDDLTEEEIIPSESGFEVKRNTPEEAEKLRSWQGSAWKKYIKSEVQSE